MQSSRVRLWLVIGVVVVAAVFVGWLFITDVGADEPGPVAFDETVQVGMTEADTLALSDEVVLPKAQVAYGNYRYIVGYFGIERASFDLMSSAIQRRLGQPLSVFVTDYTLAEVSLDADGYPVTANPVRWRPAAELNYVIDSEARTPRGPATIPFADRNAAAEFVEAHGGEVVGWDEVRDRSSELSPPEPTGSGLEAQHATADGHLDRAQQQLDRPVSAVVGRDAETIQGTIDASENDSTVLVPEGTYHEQVTIDRPITLRGEGATLDGANNDTVVRIEADGAAVTGMQIVGTGDQLQDPEGATDDPDAWDHNIELGYGHGDAGVAAIDAENVSIANITIQTRANGVLLRDAPGAVVDDSRISGTEEWRAGFMGVMAMRSPGVIQHSTISGGRDGVYMHRSHGLVVRENRLEDGRYGVHVMHSSGTLLADNIIRGEDLGGIILMTDPEANAILGNDIRESSSAITTVGSRNLVADNVVVDNMFGLRMLDHDTRYAGNVVFDNDIGVRVAGFLPTNTVINNDFVDNHEQIQLGFGPLEVWTRGGVGNYWGFDPGSMLSSAIDRPFSPTHPVDERLERVDGLWTLANAPGIALADAFQDSIPGLRQGVVDLDPLSSPANPEVLEQAMIDSSNATVISP